MNPKSITETEALRSEIELTRRRMDDTIEALGERMQGRHLLDEAIGFFRSNSGPAEAAESQVREKISQTAGQVSESAGNAVTAIVDHVKKNPLPILLIGAGAAWLAYSVARKRTAGIEDELEDSARFDPDTHYDRPIEYPDAGTWESAEMSDQAGSTFENLKDKIQEKASNAKEQVKQKLSDLGDRTLDKLHSVRDRASEFGGKVQDRTREMYDRSRQTVNDTVDQYPVEVGLGCLAIGVLIGLTLPTPAPVHRIAGPTVDRLRERTREAGREMLQKGKRVAQAAGTAARQEAESQGLTLEQLTQNGTAANARLGDATTEMPRPENSPAGDSGSTPPEADPSAARPGM